MATFDLCDVVGGELFGGEGTEEGGVHFKVLAAAMQLQPAECIHACDEFVFVLAVLGCWILGWVVDSQSLEL
jgi:hypothetical protein